MINDSSIEHIRIRTKGIYLLKKIIFHSIFEENTLRGFSNLVATLLVNLTGTMAIFGIVWGAGKI